MNEGLLALISSLAGIFAGGIITYIIQKQRFKQELEILRLTHKTDFMAEETVRHFLEHKTHVERSFEMIEKHVGGFTDEELRRILVRAGAIRSYRADGSEWWRLLSRNDEYIEKKKGL